MTKSALHDGRFVLVETSGNYETSADLYQESFDAPCVYLSYLSMGGRQLYLYLAHKYTRVYYRWDEGWDGQWDPVWEQDLRALNVGWIFFEDPSLAARVPPSVRAAVVHRGPEGVLLRLP